MYIQKWFSELPETCICIDWNYRMYRTSFLLKQYYFIIVQRLVIYFKFKLRTLNNNFPFQTEWFCNIPSSQ